MNNGELYQRSNGVQRRDAKQVLEEFSHLFNWRPDGKDTLLDIGCGSGDVTIDFILPILPIKFNKLVGADLSDGMLRYCRENFQHTRISFEKLDIGIPIDFEQFPQTFDHITSFYCLHWVENQKQAFKNIFNLLSENGGDCLLAYLAENPIFEIYKRLAENKRWSTYMTDVNRFISPFQYSKNPTDEIGNLLYTAGFTEYSVSVREKFFIYDNLEILKKSVRAVTPFLDRMPNDQHEDFLDDYIDVVTSMQLGEPNIDQSDYKFLSPYKLIVVYAKKG